MKITNVYVLKWGLLICLFFFLEVGWSQVRTGANNLGNASQNSMSDTLELVQRDTVSNAIFLFSLEDLYERKVWQDTSLEWFHEYEQTRNQDELFIHTGNLGSSTFPIFYKPTFKEGFELGHRQHDLYKKEKESIRFYDIKKPFSQVYFSPAGSQLSFTSSAKVGRDFSQGVKLAVDFRRINAESVYNHQDTRHTSFHVGVFQEVPNSKWAYALNFLSNSNFENYNGGISDTSQLEVSFRGVRTNVPVYLGDTYSYNLSRKYIGNLYFFLEKKTNRKQYLSLELQRSNDLYKMIDKSLTSNDTLKFGSQFMTNELGLRLHNKLYSNTIQLGYHLNTQNLNSLIYGRYTLHQLHRDIGKNNISDAIIGTKTRLAWKKLNLYANGWFGQSNGQTILDIHPRLNYTANTWFDAEVGFRFHVRPPDLHEYQMIITGIEVYNKSLPSSTIQMLYGKIGMPKIGLHAKLESVASQNAIYFNGEKNEFDILGNVNYIHFTIAERFHWKWLELYTSFSTQVQNQSVYGTPSWYSRHGVAYSGTLFQSKMLMHAGVTLDYIPAHDLPNYHVITSQLFGVGNRVSNQYRLDAHVNFKVQGFRFFAKYENIAALWSKKVNYQVSEYPQLDGRVRLGVSWELRN